MGVTKEGFCRLCGKQTVLCESHIVPEFMYKPVYAERQMIGFKKGHVGVKPQVYQKGLREYLLCGDCEAFLNNSYERPNVRTWEALVHREESGGVAFAYGTTPQGTELVDVRGVDYPSFKLLLLSILWRAGVAKRQEYEAVTLGPYEEKIRHMLLSRDPGPSLLLPCVVTLLKRPVRLISPPARGKYAGHTTYQFILTSIALWFFISNRTHREPMLEAVLKEDGSFQALFSEPEELPVYNETMRWIRRTKALLSGNRQ
jgi:hypothetical protein